MGRFLAVFLCPSNDLALPKPDEKPSLAIFAVLNLRGDLTALCCDCEPIRRSTDGNGDDDCAGVGLRAKIRGGEEEMVIVVVMVRRTERRIHQ